jgi:phospholipid transport system substrate-binding protein
MTVAFNSKFPYNAPVLPRLEAIEEKIEESFMGPKRSLVFILLGTVLFLFGAGPDTKTSSPESTVRALLKNVKFLSETDDKAEEARFSRQISVYFDVQEICKACLRKTWTSLSTQERANFVKLFQTLLETVAYPKSSDFFKGTEVELEDISEQGAKAQVDTVVMHPDEGMVEVSFCLADVKGTWLIEDIQLDGVSLVIDLRSQMQKILKEHSYKELKKRLQDKLDDAN